MIQSDSDFDILNYTNTWSFNWFPSVFIDCYKIGGFVFVGDNNITKLTLGEKVKYIGVNAVSSCKFLKKVIINSQLQVIYSNCFGKCSSDLTITYKNKDYTTLSEFFNKLKSENVIIVYVNK